MYTHVYMHVNTCHGTHVEVNFLFSFCRSADLIGKPGFLCPLRHPAGSSSFHPLPLEWKRVWERRWCLGSQSPYRCSIYLAPHWPTDRCDVLQPATFLTGCLAAGHPPLSGLGTPFHPCHLFLSECSFAFVAYFKTQLSIFDV